MLLILVDQTEKNIFEQVASDGVASMSCTFIKKGTCPFLLSRGAKLSQFHARCFCFSCGWSRLVAEFEWVNFFGISKLVYGSSGAVTQQLVDGRTNVGTSPYQFAAFPSGHACYSSFSCYVIYSTVILLLYSMHGSASRCTVVKNCLDGVK